MDHTSFRSPLNVRAGLIGMENMPANQGMPGRLGGCGINPLRV